MVSVNLIQHKVLQWHSKVETDPPNDEWKTSASAVEGGGAISRKTGEYVATLTDVGKLYLLDNPTPPAPKLPRKPRLPKPAAEEPLSIESEVAKQLSTGVSPTTAPKRINRMKRPGFCSSVLLRRIWVCPRDIHRNLELVRCGLSRIDSRAILECRSVPC